MYLDLRAEELVRQGMAPEEARRLAEERFGDRRAIERRLRRQSRHGKGEGMMMETVGQDLSFALRTFRRNPGFTAVAALTLGLAVAGNTAIFSVLDAAVLHAMPFRGADRLVFVNGYHLTDGQRAVRYASVPEFRDWRERSRTVSPMVGVDANSFTLSGNGEAERVTGEVVSRGFFELLGGEPALGRTFSREEYDTPDGFPVVVLSHDLWARRFGSDPEVVGRTLEINEQRVTVLGVMPPQFRGIAPDAELWVPMGMISLVGSAGILESRGTRFLPVIGRLAPGVNLARAQDELDAIARDLQAEHPDVNRDRFAQVQSFRDAFLGTTGRLLWILLGAGALLLLIAAANVANLLLVRTHSRTRELVVRRAVGAEGGRLVRQLLTESLLLAAIGGAVGLILAGWAVRSLAPMIPMGVLPDYAAPAMSARVFLFSLGVVTLAGCAAGLAPALAGARSDLAGALRGSGRRFSRRHGRVRDMFVVVQVSVALLLLVGAGLLVRSFRAQLAVDPGLEMDGIQVFRVSLPREQYPDAASLGVFTRELMRRVGDVPGVSDVSVSSDFPFRNRTSGSYIARPDDVEHLIRYYRHSVSPGYFEHLGVRVLQGRGFTPSDDESAPRVVLVTQAMVDRVFPDDPTPIGRTIYVGNPNDPGNTAEIVGVVENVRYRDLTQSLMAEPNSPDVFYSIRQMPSRTLEVSFEAPGGLASVLPEIRAAVRGLDPSIPIYASSSLRTAYLAQTATPRFAAFLMGLFSALALALAAVGVYGVLAFGVGLRAPELAIRRALGAGAGTVAASVLLGALRLVAIGLVLGSVAALLSSRFLDAFLFGVRPADPVTFGAVAAGMLAVALLSSALPAWRAIRQDPMVALNTE